MQETLNFQRWQTFTEESAKQAGDPLRAERRANPVTPSSRTHSLADDGIGVRAMGASGTRRSARPLTLEGKECSIPRAHRAARSRTCELNQGCLKFEFDVTRCEPTRTAVITRQGRSDVFVASPADRVTQ